MKKVSNRNCGKNTKSCIFTILVALCHSDLSFNRFGIFFVFVILGSLSNDNAEDDV